MILSGPKENGVLLKSARFSFSTPSPEDESARELFYYMPWCGHFFCDSRYRYERKHYPYCLLVYVQAGVFHFDYRNRHFDAQAGEVVLLDCTEPHCYYGSDGLEFYYIHFDGVNSHALCQYILERDGALIQSGSNHLIFELMKDTISCYQNNGYETPAEVSVRVSRFLQILLLSQKQASETEDPILYCIQYIHKNISSQISVKDLAEMAHLSPFYFSRLFRKRTGFSPVIYMQNLRLNQARNMLMATDLSVQEIGLALGYVSGSSFSNVFTEKTGCSPKQYRELMNH